MILELIYKEFNKEQSIFQFKDENWKIYEIIFTEDSYLLSENEQIELARQNIINQIEYENRKSEFEKAMSENGVTYSAKLNALWELTTNNNNVEINQLKAKEIEIKKKYGLWQM